MAKSTLAVLVSGAGTTVEACIKAYAAGETAMQVALVISSNPLAGAFEKINVLNEEYGLDIELAHIGKKTHPHLEDEEEALLEILSQKNCDVITLMGYMRKIGPKLVNTYGWRQDYVSPYQAKLLNTHPGLLPQTKALYGLRVQELVLAQGHEQAGQTLHIVSEEYDEGPIVSENKIAVLPGDTPQSLFDRVQTKEKQCIAQDIERFIIERKRYLEVQHE